MRFDMTEMRCRLKDATVAGRSPSFQLLRDINGSGGDPLIQWRDTDGAACGHAYYCTKI